MGGGPRQLLQQFIIPLRAGRRPMAAAVLPIHNSLIMSQADISGHSRAPLPPFPQWPPNKRGRGRREKTKGKKQKERNKGKSHSTAGLACRPFSLFSLLLWGPPYRPHAYASDPCIPQNVQDHLRCPLVPKQPDRGGPWESPPTSLPYTPTQPSGLGRPTLGTW